MNMLENSVSRACAIRNATVVVGETSTFQDRTGKINASNQVQHIQTCI